MFVFVCVCVCVLKAMSLGELGGGVQGPVPALHRMVDPYLAPLNQALTKVAPKLLPVARICILSTYFEDGLRMVLQRSEQARYFKHTWRCGYTLAYLFVFVNMLLQVREYVFEDRGLGTRRRCVYLGGDRK